jgi:hypothetical protein
MLALGTLNYHIVHLVLLNCCASYLFLDKLVLATKWALGGHAAPEAPTKQIDCLESLDKRLSDCLVHKESVRELELKEMKVMRSADD